MRFMVMVKANSDYEAGQPPSAALMDAIGRLAEREFRDGRMVDMGGLNISDAARVRAGSGRVRVVDGPFAEAKEVIGGYAVLQVQSREEALEMAREFMQTHIDVLGAEFDGECELRRILGSDETQ